MHDKGCVLAGQVISTSFAIQNIATNNTYLLISSTGLLLVVLVLETQPGGILSILVVCHA